MSIGTSLRRFEDERLLKGEGRFVEDIRVANCYEAVFVRSPLACGLIKAIDVSAALRTAGVVAVLTGHDLEAAGVRPMKCRTAMPSSDGTPFNEPVRPVLAIDRVLNRQEIVVKEFYQLTARHPLFGGGTLDATGRVIPILNLPALLKYCERATQSQTAAPAGPDAAGQAAETPRVLVVDDSLSVRKVQERFLRALGCEVASAADGLHALERLREQKFDLVFTDLEMPRVNGYELISEIRSHPAWVGLPVVVISSRGADKYITKAMNLGANSFLSKPFTEEQLTQVLSFYVGWDAATRTRTAVRPGELALTV